MDTLAAIFSRRSVRTFLARPVEGEKLQTLLRAAMYAPSAVNEQPWQFIVISDKELFGQIMAVHPYSSMLRSAPLAILVCGDLGLERVPGNWVLDCACAAQNLLLAAQDMGLGGVWVGIYPETDRMEALSGICRLPETVRPLALVVVGYPAGAAAEVPDRFRGERVRLNGWNEQYPFDRT